MMTKMVMAVLSLVAIFPVIVFAQQTSANATVSDNDIQLLRQDLQSGKKQVVAANMLLTSAEAQKFWPVYDEYAAETAKVNDAKVSVIKDYAANFEKLTDDQAMALITRWSQADQSSLQLRLKYFPMFQKVLPGKKAARFFQIDRRIGILMDVQLASEIPLVQP